MPVEAEIRCAMLRTEDTGPRRVECDRDLQLRAEVPGGGTAPRVRC